MAKDPRDSRAWKALRLKVLARDQWTCGYCQQPATTVDHIMPIKDHPDMAMSLDNLISACKPCNSSKGSRSQGVFLARQSTPPVFQGKISPMQSKVQQDSPFTARPVSDNPDHG